MTLPVGQLKRSTYSFDGNDIPIRSLSRAEALHIKEIADDLEASEVWILQCGTDSTPEEVAAFRNSQPAQGVDDLVEAIAVLSGIWTQQANGGPKA